MQKIIVRTKNGKTIEKTPKPINFQTKMNIRISTDQFNKFKEIAQSKHINYSDIVRDLINYYIKDNGIIESEMK